MTSIGPFAAPGRWFKGNLHTHSTASDGRASPAAVCRRYREAGYDFLAVTDHFLERFGYPITDTLGEREDGFTTLLGAELHVPATRHGDPWHLLAVGLPRDFATPAAGEGAPELARRAAAAGAFVAIPHPEWSGLEVEDACAIDAAHAVEVYNHTSALRCARGGGTALWDQLLVRGRRLGAIATDDAHFVVEDWCGGWVQVKAAANEPGALVAALKAGHFYASQGPALLDVAVDGDRLHVRSSPCQRLVALGAGAAQANEGGTNTTEAAFDLNPFRRAGYVRVVALDAGGRAAWSNAIELDR